MKKKGRLTESAGLRGLQRMSESRGQPEGCVCKRKAVKEVFLFFFQV
jgi:hypothetical protein